MGSTPTFRLGRALQLGLALGTGAGSLLLAARALSLLRSAAADDGDGPNDFQFGVELTSDLARLHGLGALGLGLVAAGLAWTLRDERQSSPDERGAGSAGDGDASHP